MEVGLSRTTWSFPGLKHMGSEDTSMFLSDEKRVISPFRSSPLEHSTLITYDIT